ncbi:alpha/beta hydrolase [Intrasporangium oryzae NRRL B-24470]|uniref:Alpha/beta hydrolase n=1 Tax=Intrasporangium oryzae NRRL B-24470 TaxID=1386089 RepID=W9G0T3_9MICO|nr:alpha/beta hydrolase [Intrasporangium oryzae]EWS99690.1 alpha/beta hydrolase [Intrasporangium oryzae NRRL B-24470]
MSVDAAFVNIEGPWEHRFVSANGARFHVAELGHGPLVLMLHGFPQFWYTWRHQMVALAEAGYRVAAMDLRGYGGSDKPPRGYDTYMSTLDTASVIRALGEQHAVIVGIGLGGWISWCMPALRPDVTRAVAALSMPHPRVMRRAVWRDRHQRQAARWIVGLQTPFVPERRMASSRRYVAGLLRSWSAKDGGYPSSDDTDRYADAMMIPFVAHSASEHYRWLGRSSIRPDGPIFMRRIRGAIRVPVLQLQGSEDRCVLADATHGSGAYVPGDYRLVTIEGAGHFLTEEAPEQVNEALLTWLAGLS